MFRRRPIRRLRRIGRRRPVGSGRPVPEPLRQAMRLLEEGKFQEAADAFDALAQTVEERGGFLRAANLWAQAARCYLKLDNVDEAYTRGMKALDLFKQAERPGAGRRLAEKMVKVLKENGRGAEAEALERELQQMPAAGRPRGRRGELPGKCSQCGGPVRESEANWVGPNSAECPYCGSVLKAE